MGKRIVAIKGSPHISGNVSAALDKMIDGARFSGHECTEYVLSKLNIKNCCGCRKCIENGGMCILQDDMKPIFEEIKSADVLIIGSPIYICQVNGYVKTFLDRMYPMTDERHKPRFGVKKLVMLYTYGAPIPFIFHKYIKYTGKSLKAMGLVIDKNIVIHGCTKLDKVKSDTMLLEKLFEIGQNL